jgi:hypothetical protein
MGRYLELAKTVLALPSSLISLEVRKGTEGIKGTEGVPSAKSGGTAVEWWDDLLWPAGCPHVPVLAAVVSMDKNARTMPQESVKN